MASDTSIPEQPGAMEKVPRAIRPSIVMVGLITAALPAGHAGTTFGTLTEAWREHSTPDTFTLRAAVNVISAGCRT